MRSRPPTPLAARLFSHSVSSGRKSSELTQTTGRYVELPDNHQTRSPMSSEPEPEDSSRRNNAILTDHHQPLPWIDYHWSMLHITRLMSPIQSEMHRGCSREAFLRTRKPNACQFANYGALRLTSKLGTSLSAPRFLQDIRHACRMSSLK